MSDFRLPFRQTAGLLIALAVFAALPARGQATPSDSVLRGFQATGEYVLLVNGQADLGSEVFVNRSLPAYLILPTTLSPILITPGAGTVATVPKAKIVRQKDGTVDLLADAVTKPQGKLVIGDGRVDFTTEGKKASLGPKPPLIGLKKSAELKKHTPEYVQGAKAYTPNPTSLAKLKSQAAPVRVVVFFGSWCPHCKEMLPHLLRVEDEIRGSKIQFDYRGISRDFKDPEVQRLKVSEVPTAVVYDSNGREIGRLTRNDWAAPEVALSVMLGGAGKTGK
ncbi:MAG TPA: TlpA disulfide reductase family protein [Thermoanaerobaculia bacterium]|nr:TlpA disulfide reductase family protein [Thermoanaerobaculia bacterium]